MLVQMPITEPKSVLPVRPQKYRLHYPGTFHNVHAESGFGFPHAHYGHRLNLVT